ncbi:uncharacterized protein TNCT_116851 [Trichonephila clavata]|uniref:RNase H type-1 domain-containing protein n=1 Tax=Trichonephila clavata TaxID=2740835 RepID=A0A8X6LVM8_TRICU|nr:uncharacterized protein TNCT_116851 [Trichonephila clavata]
MGGCRSGIGCSPISIRLFSGSLGSDQRALAYETTERRYSNKLRIHVYTDGSMIERGTGAGAGVYCNPFAFYKAVGRDTTSFDGVETIFIALNQLSALKSNFSWAVTLFDRKAALQAISNNKV